MTKYRKKGQVDIYEKEKTDWASIIIGGIIILFIIGSCAG